MTSRNVRVWAHAGVLLCSAVATASLLSPAQAACEFTSVKQQMKGLNRA
jgi:hypothetical protein